MSLKLLDVYGDVALVQHDDGNTYWYRFGRGVTTYVLAEGMYHLPPLKVFDTYQDMYVWWAYDRTAPGRGG